MRKEIFDASNLDGHIIVFGCASNLLLFVAELRRSAIADFDFHPIVIVSEVVPPEWDLIVKKYREVYFIRGAMTTPSGVSSTFK